MAHDTTIPTPRRSAKDAGAHRLLVVYSPERRHTGVTTALDAAPCAIGRSGSDRGLELDDAEVSRAHALVEPSPDGQGFTIRDLGSRNGTFVNGERIDLRRLTHGDVIRLGSHILVFEFLTIEAAKRIALPRRAGSLLIGESASMGAVRAGIREASPLPAPVLILGESGVGKELVAAEVHAQSGRQGPLLAINCAALPEQLFESELFGHVRGAFSGAAAPSQGVFGEADGGTLFLDEIGEMTIALQPKLLRALATGEIRAVGETRARMVDVRIVAATNVDLEAAIEAGRFRADLYARLSGWTLRIPPLRERRDDVIRLADHFLARHEGPVSIGPDAAEALLIHPWRFNVRELEQVVRALPSAVRDRGFVDLADLPAPLREPFGPRTTMSPPAPALEVPLALRVRRDGVPTAEDLRTVLEHYEGNIVEVAVFFGRDRRQVYRWAKRHGIDLAAARSSEPDDHDSEE